MPTGDFSSGFVQINTVDNSTTSGTLGGIVTLPSTTSVPGNWSTGTSGTGGIISGSSIVNNHYRQEEPDVQEVIDQIESMGSKKKLFKIIEKCRNVNEDIDKILKGLLDTTEMKLIFIYLRNVKNKNLRIAEAANNRIVDCL